MAIHGFSPKLTVHLRDVSSIAFPTFGAGMQSASLTLPPLKSLLCKDARICHGTSTWSARHAQECKALNGRLIEFLKRPENVAKLVTYVTEPASMTAEDKRQFKYPFASCEVPVPPSHVPSYDGAGLPALSSQLLAHRFYLTSTRSGALYRYH